MSQMPVAINQPTMLDRDATTRLDDALLAAAWVESGTLLLSLHDGTLPIFERDGVVELYLAPVEGELEEGHTFMGRLAGTAVFVRAIDEAPQATADGQELSWRHPFIVGDRLSAAHQEIMMVALALLNWHRSMPYSPRDGSLTVPVQGGWARVDDRGGEHFPRTDPAVIVLVEHNNKLLLGSNVLWETGRFSLLAGFVEAGESAEQAVVREIFEEAGVHVDRVQYVSSQSWPFPRSLMLGFRAKLVEGSDPEQLVADAAEISELRWFSRSELREPAPGMLLPGSLSIARKLIDMWVEEGDSGE